MKLILKENKLQSLTIRNEILNKIIQKLQINSIKFLILQVQIKIILEQFILIKAILNRITMKIKINQDYQKMELKSILTKLFQSMKTMNLKIMK